MNTPINPDAAAATPETGAPAGNEDAAKMLGEAFQTIATFISAQVEKGTPGSNAMMAWLQKGLEMMAGGSSNTQQQQPEQPEQEQPENENSTPMTRDINAGKGSAKVI